MKSLNSFSQIEKTDPLQSWFPDFLWGISPFVLHSIFSLVWMLTVWRSPNFPSSRDAAGHHRARWVSCFRGVLEKTSLCPHFSELLCEHCMTKVFSLSWNVTKPQHCHFPLFYYLLLHPLPNCIRCLCSDTLFRAFWLCFGGLQRHTYLAYFSHLGSFEYKVIVCSRDKHVSLLSHQKRVLF